MVEFQKNESLSKKHEIKKPPISFEGGRLRMLCFIRARDRGIRAR